MECRQHPSLYLEQTAPAGSSGEIRTILEVGLRARSYITSALLAIACVGSAASAQDAFTDVTPVPYSRIVSLNPVLLVFQGIISADYEQRLAGSTTLGASLSSFSFSKADYLTLEGRARYYVTGRAFDGIAVGAVAGVVRLTEDSSRVTSTAMNLGFTLERQWLLGIDERVALTAGAGATRLFFAEDRPAFRSVLPILRLSIGWGF